MIESNSTYVTRNSLWRKITSLGIDESVPNRDVRYIKASNAAILINFICGIPLALVAVLMGYPVSNLAFSLLINLGIVVFLLWLNTKKRFLSMQIALLCSILLNVVGYSRYSPEIGKIFAVLGIVATFIIVPVRRRIIGAMFASIFLIGFLSSVFDLTSFFPEIEAARKMGVVHTRTTEAVAGLVILFVALYGAREMARTEDSLETERARADSILMRSLPKEIAMRLKDGEVRIADSFKSVSVLFADIVGFTEFSKDRSPSDIVSLLDDLFREFDSIARDFGIEKIKTIGDAYMAAAGVPQPIPDHQAATIEMALRMHHLMSDAGSRFNGLRIRVGIHTGPVIAGIIGEQKYLYDLWGDAVNTASRMESHGLPGETQVTGEVAVELRDRYRFENRGEIEVKGKGLMSVYLVKGRIAKSQSDFTKPPSSN